MNEWTGQLSSSYIYGAVLEKMGYKVEYVTAGAVPQYEALVTGNITANPETWDNNVGDIYPKAIASGDLVILGPLGLQAMIPGPTRPIWKKSARVCRTGRR